ncbi:hypothetical protein NUW54_g7972 [Trametes sanguinea]|uniref:Uncharacterized protein n=1 Tax=Trametes sanguinea TaxID=158606 RepID=A0ACC1PHL1_9APHY|nr:hypothetical protein NUW54_g7972 [Trametes sanguinea]
MVQPPKRVTTVYDTAFLVPTSRPFATWELAEAFRLSESEIESARAEGLIPREETIAETKTADGGVLGRWVVGWDENGVGTCREIGQVVRYFNVHQELLPRPIRLTFRDHVVTDHQARAEEADADGVRNDELGRTSRQPKRSELATICEPGEGVHHHAGDFPGSVPRIVMVSFSRALVSETSKPTMRVQTNYTKANSPSQTANRSSSE